jgi:DNA polymerase-3 subunit chi
LIDNAACRRQRQLRASVLVFNGEDADALAAARERWTTCKARGFEVTYWQRTNAAAGSAGNKRYKGN